jgi:NAD(P)H-hydrate epimerase
MKVLSAAEMQACDHATADRYGIPTIELMRSAAQAVTEFARRCFPEARRVTVLCGRGNNGGDGMMAARLLADSGLEVTTILLGAPEKFAADAAIAWEELRSAVYSGAIEIATTSEDFARLASCFDADLLIDAVVGTGFTPPLRGLALEALPLVQKAKKVLAVDLPSGWPADATTAACENECYPADAVMTFTAPKPAHLFGHLTRGWQDQVAVAQIGSPEKAIVSELNLTWAGSSLEMVQKPRPVAANKGNFGHVLVVGGSFGSAGCKTGAPSMAALAALRAGAGLVTAAVPAPALSAVAAVAPELMTVPLVCAAHGGLTEENLIADRLVPLLARKTVLAIGPGLGQSPETIRFLSGLLLAAKVPVVLDADGLNMLAALPQLWKELTQNEKKIILTPHPGEMARLAHKTVAEVQADRLGTAREFAQRWGVTVVLKGARTVIAHPDGRAAVNTTGNPGMSKGGSGDVLGGLVAGLVAQYPEDLARAVEAAVALHGLAADLAVRQIGEHSLLATDSLRFLGRAFRFPVAENFRNEAPRDYVCIQGMHCCHRPGPMEAESVRQTERVGE